MRSSIWSASFACAVTLLASTAAAAEGSVDASGVEATPDTFPARVDAIEVRGLVRTKEYVVLREIGIKPGDVVPRDAWELAIVRLWNTGLWSRVEGRLEGQDGKTVAVFELEERWTLIPTLDFESGGGVFYLQLGASDTNTLGHFVEVGGYYERFNQFNGGQVTVRDPRFLGRRIEATLTADRLYRPRDDFAVLRTRARGSLYVYAWKDRIRYGGASDVFDDRFSANGDRTSAYARNPPLQGTLEELSFRLGRIDTVRIRRTGVTFEAKPAIGITSDDVNPVFGRLGFEVLGFAMAGERWNFALRGQAGTMTRAPTHLAYYLGGLDVVRGIQDSSVVTRAFVSSNAEIRFTAFDSTWLALVPAVFADGAVARREIGSRLSIYSVGGGLRAIVPRLAGVVVRADIAVPLYVTPTLGLNLGIGQFF